MSCEDPKCIQEKRESEVRYDEVIEAYDDRCRALEKAEARLAEAEEILTRLVQNTMVGKEETWKARVQVIEDEADAFLAGGEGPHGENCACPPGDYHGLGCANPNKPLSVAGGEKE